MWQKLFLYLKDLGYKVYSIGQHEGLCTEPYIVLKQNGQYGNDGAITGYGIIDVIAFYPLGSYSKIERFKNKLLEDLKKFSNIKFTGEITPDIVDDSKKAYTFSTKLQIHKLI